MGVKGGLPDVPTSFDLKGGAVPLVQAKNQTGRGSAFFAALRRSEDLES